MIGESFEKGCGSNVSSRSFILGDPGAVSRDDKMFVVKAY